MILDTINVRKIAEFYTKFYITRYLYSDLIKVLLNPKTLLDYIDSQLSDYLNRDVHELMQKENRSSLDPAQLESLNNKKRELMVEAEKIAYIVCIDMIARFVFTSPEQNHPEHSALYNIIQLIKPIVDQKWTAQEKLVTLQDQLLSHKETLAQLEAAELASLMKPMDSPESFDNTDRDLALSATYSSAFASIILFIVLSIIASNPYFLLGAFLITAGVILISYASNQCTKEKIGEINNSDSDISDSIAYLKSEIEQKENAIALIKDELSILQDTMNLCIADAPNKYLQPNGQLFPTNVPMTGNGSQNFFGNQNVHPSQEHFQPSQNVNAQYTYQQPHPSQDYLHNHSHSSQNINSQYTYQQNHPVQNPSETVYYSYSQPVQNNLNNGQPTSQQHHGYRVQNSNSFFNHDHPQNHFNDIHHCSLNPQQGF